MRFLTFTAAIMALAAGAAAQQPAPEQLPEGEIPTISVEVDLVNILCSVRDKNGGLVSTLTKDDFILKEDGVAQEIKYFARDTDLPLTIGLLVDVSKSQENLIEVERQAAYRFFAEVLRPKDLAFLMSFGTDSELLQDLTGSPELLRRGLADLRLNAAVGGVMPGPIPTRNRPGTVLYDAVYLAAEDMLKGEVGRKVIAVISDGFDVGSRVTIDRAVEAAQKSDVIIYGIYYADPRYQQFGSGYGKLKDMAEETGGRVFRVSRKNTLERVFQEIQDEMRSQYALGYTPSNPEKDGSFRQIRVETKQKGLKVQARNGYYASRRR